MNVEFGVIDVDVDVLVFKVRDILCLVSRERGVVFDESDESASFVLGSVLANSSPSWCFDGSFVCEFGFLNECNSVVVSVGL